jgi:hypothetical protein
LRATAKVALSLTVFGCGSRVTVVAQEGSGEVAPSQGGAPTTPTSTVSAGGARHAQGGAGGTAPATCSPSDPGELVTLDPQTFGCCVDFLDEQTDDAWATPPEKLTACCHEVVGQIDLDPSLLALVDEALVAPVWPEKDAPSCCNILGNPCTAPCGCTVWGPPVPARLEGHLWSLDRLEAA